MRSHISDIGAEQPSCHPPGSVDASIVDEYVRAPGSGYGYSNIGYAILGASLLAQKRDREAEALMRAADRGLKPIAGRQGRDRDANLARLRSLTPVR